MVFVFCGCTGLWRGFWNEITGKETESSKTAEEVVDTGKDIAAEFEETGKIDANKIVALVKCVKDFAEDTKKEKEEAPTTAELLGSMLATGVVAYLGARRIRKSPIGEVINKGLLFLPKIVGLVEDVKKKKKG